MRDRDIVAAIVAGDPAGLAAAYDSYAASLHAYCRTLLGEPADAADAVQDTFVIAAAKLGGLRDADRLRPWLYAVARNECHRRLRGRARQADLDEAGDVTDAVDVGQEAERGELRGLVLAALGGLNPGDREVIELNLRHDLDGADLAGALGVPANQAHALASRARGQLERSLGALLVARTGRDQCAELDALLAGWDGQLTVLLRKRVSRHIEQCDTCGDRKRRELSPAMLLSVLPLVAMPAELREQILRLVSDPHPDAAAYRARVASRAEPFDDAGFPVQIAPAARPPRRPSRGVALGAVAALVLLLAGGAAVAYVLLSGTSHNVALRRTTTTARPAATSRAPALSASPSASRKARSGSPTPTASTASPSPSTSSSTPDPSPSVSVTRSSPPPSKSPTPPASSSPTPTPTGTLTESPSTIKLGGSDWSGTFTLTASGGQVSYSVFDPSGSYLLVSPAAGTLKAGQSVTITVTANPNDPPPQYYNTLTVTPGSITVGVYYPPQG
jgi:RNA polymerase sigma factor (sigma-70 family)